VAHLQHATALISKSLNKLAVVIPCYKVRDHVLAVIAKIGPEVDCVFVVDDACPDGSGHLVETDAQDPRVKIIRNPSNLGVGGAVIAGYLAALEAGCDVIVKLDGDGQMDPSLIPNFVNPILSGEADYTKGNRFFRLEGIGAMPGLRIFGNAALSFMAKFSTGYWNLFDPTNGYTAIHAKIVHCLPLEKVSKRYFFETDMLFRLNSVGAVVLDIPMDAKYGDEVSNLKIGSVWGEFMAKHLKNAVKRIFYNYYLRDMSAASIELPLGLLLMVFGISYGAVHWFNGVSHDVATPAGTVMLAALPTLLGAQLLIGFLNFDVANVPSRPLYPRLGALLAKNESSE
jgi:dolichol-phosphate mannosyltransferase